MLKNNQNTFDRFFAPENITRWAARFIIAYITYKLLFCNYEDE